MLLDPARPVSLRRLPWRASLLEPAHLWRVLPWILFSVLALLAAAVNALPALAGDEYGSLHEGAVLGTNLHALGYFVQLHFWQLLDGSDLFLRVLSLIWTGLGIWWLDRWLASEALPAGVRRGATLLLVANAFLWMYGLQVRFYAFFLATAILAFWRFRLWQQAPDRRRGLLLGLSLLLVCSAHLFGLLVAGILGFCVLWGRLRGKRLYLLGGAAILTLVLFIPQVHAAAVLLVYRMTALTSVPDVTSRGLSLAMLAKVPLTFYFFTLGERVYPFAWWFTVPAMLLTGAAFLLGLWRLRRYPGINVLVSAVLLSVPVLYLVLDPLAPPALQGAAPRYVIYALPVFLLVVALGAAAWRPLLAGAGLVACLGLAGFFWPAWSDGGADLMNWPQALRQDIPVAAASCVVVDGRARAPVQRYAPPGTTIVDHVDRCAGYARVLLVSNDFKLPNTRPLDLQETRLAAAYDLAASYSLFPAQIAVYTSALGGATALPPARLDLPEQDLRLPVRVPGPGWQLPGFVRLDATTPGAHLPLQVAGAPVWILSNYQPAAPVAAGTPVATLVLQGVGGARATVSLRAGLETAPWAGQCSRCTPVAGWHKLLTLVGAAYYSDAYRDYQAQIWGTPAPPLAGPITAVDVTNLLPAGTFYFWGLYAGNAR